jgi:putative RecB family exonuclease
VRRVPSSDDVSVAVHELAGSAGHTTVLVAHATGFRGHGDTRGPLSGRSTGYGDDALAAARASCCGRSRGARRVRPLDGRVRTADGGGALFRLLVLFEPIVHPTATDEADSADNPWATTARRRRPVFDSFDDAIANYASKPPLAPGAARRPDHLGRRRGRPSMTTMTPPPYDKGVFEVPTSLSPSRVEQFTTCPLAFRFASIEKLPERPSVHATRGSLVHRALELAYSRPAPEREPALFRRALEAARDEFGALPDYTGLGLSDEQAQVFDDECRALVETYLTMEDPKSVHPIGLELRLSAEVGSLALRGIIDRLELRDGELVVTDYKTGRAPSANWEQKSLAGVHFYSFLCEEVLGRRPVAIRLMYLSSGETIEATPSEQSVRFITTRTTAVWKAVERACITGDFKSRPGAICAACSFQPWCPSFGGDPERAAAEAPVAIGPALVALVAT